MKRCFLTLWLLSDVWFALAQQSTISGYVKDASNGEALIGATVLVSGTSTGAVTNVYGFYSITLPHKDYKVEYRYIGYQSVFKTISLSKNERLDIELTAESQELEEIVVSGVPEDINVSGMQMSTNQLDIETLSKMPAFLGEVDVLRSIQMLPGVSTVGEGASGFNVRGGSVGQNMVLLDEAPVYNSSHLFGFFSVFNPDAVKDVKLIKGGIPPRYGGRISSVLDIRMKEGNAKKFEAQGGVGTIFSRLAVEGPIVKNKASFVVAGRRSYVDILARPFLSGEARNAGLNFYDVTAKANWNINDKNRVFLSGYLGRDVFRFDATQGFNWGNITATARWNHIFNERLFSNFTLLYSNYNYNLKFGSGNNTFAWSSKVLNYDFKAEFTYFMNPKNELSFGGELLRLRFRPAKAATVTNGELSDRSLPLKHALEASVYLSNDQKISENLQVQYGVRYTHFSLLGSGEEYYFRDTIPGIRKPLIRTETYATNQTIITYNNFEPRVSIKYQLNSANSFKASYNRTAQYIHLISNTTASIPLDVWAPSSNNIKPQIGQQFALGWFRNFGSNNQYEASVESYYRKTENQMDYINGANLLINEHVEGDLLSGKGRAYGLELHLKKNAGRFTGWVSYTLAKTELKVAGVNNHEWYPTRYDQRHNLKVAGFYEINPRITLSSNFVFLTGTPATFPTSKYYFQGRIVPYIYGDSRNNFRIPNYHRLDLSLTLHAKSIKRNGKPRKNKSYWVFSVYNVYARENPFSIYFAQGSPLAAEIQSSSDGSETQARQLSIIGFVIPAVSYNFKF